MVELIEIVIGARKIGVGGFVGNDLDRNFLGANTGNDRLVVFAKAESGNLVGEASCEMIVDDVELSVMRMDIRNDRSGSSKVIDNAVVSELCELGTSMRGRIKYNPDCIVGDGRKWIFRNGVS